MLQPLSPAPVYLVNNKEGLRFGNMIICFLGYLGAQIDIDYKVKMF